MSFPRYPKYKDSGVEWLGEVPEHWEVLPCRAIVHERTAKNEGAACTDYLSLMANVGVIPYAEKGDVGNKKPEDVSKCKIVARGDFVINSMNYGIGSYGLSNYDGVCSSVYIVLKPQNDVVESRFAFRIFENRTFQTFAQSFGNGILEHRCSINWDILKPIGVCVPPLVEQKAILAFLDRETAKIDELVAEQRRLMELLKEKRQAVISHAVTQGLNPQAPMKPSGIEWLGEVPEHWRVGAIKYFVLAKNGSIKTGPFGSHLISSDMQSGTIKVYNQRSVIDGDFDSGDNFISEEKFAELASFETFPGDLLITTRGTIGRAAILPENAERGILHPCLLRLQPDTSLIDTRFLKTLIQDSDLMKTQLSYLSNATTIEVIYSYTIASVIIPVPPILEQAAIMQFLADESTKFDTLTAEAQRAIDLLQERRTALISAAVTGQIDVRRLS